MSGTFDPVAAAAAAPTLLAAFVSVKDAYGDHPAMGAGELRAFMLGVSHALIAQRNGLSLEDLARELEGLAYALGASPVIIARR